LLDLTKKMVVYIRGLSKNLKKKYKLPVGLFLHKGKQVKNLHEVGNGDWLVEVPVTDCAWLETI